MSGVKLLTVSVDEGEQRLDRWFKRRFPTSDPRGGGKDVPHRPSAGGWRPCKGSDRVVPGQEIRVPPMPNWRRAVTPGPDGVSAADTKMIQILRVVQR